MSERGGGREGVSLKYFSEVEGERDRGRQRELISELLIISDHN